MVGVYVRPEQRGRGVRQALLTALVAHARALPGVDRLSVAVAATQTAAQAVYLAGGFSAWGTEPAFLLVDGESIDEHFLTLRLR